MNQNRIGRLGKHTLLSLGVTSNKVVETLGTGLSTVDGEGEVVVLEVETNTGKVDDGLNAGLSELGGVTC